MDRIYERTKDLKGSVMMLCDGDAVQFDLIMRSPVSVYEAKLSWFADTHKPEKKNQDQVIKKRPKR